MIKVSLLISLILILSLAGGSEYAFGTKVLPADADVGRPLSDVLSVATISYWDTGAPGYDENDVVYLHTAPSGYSTVYANDVRLTPFGEHPAGSKVTSQDKDIGMPITLLPATINYLNLHGSRAYDLEDPVYVHQIDCSYSDTKMAEEIKDGFKERLPHLGGRNPFVRANCVTFTDGYKLLVSDKLADNNPQIVGNWRGLNIELVQGLENNYYHVLDTWLVKIIQSDMSTDGSSIIDAIFANQFIHTNDIRLSTAGGPIPGTKVMDFDIDQNKLISLPPLLSFPIRTADRARIRYFDVDGNGVYDYPDDVYLDLPEGAFGNSVLVNDVRLSGPI